jgi:hypothetical protein
MLKSIKHYSTGKNVLLFFAAASLVYGVMVYLTIPQVIVYSGGMKLFDLMPAGYDPAYARKLLDTLGEPGRHLYLTRQLPLDMLYPGLSGIAYCLMMAWFMKKLNVIGSAAVYLCFIPPVACLFDYLENFGIISMIVAYPDIPAWQAGLVSIFTIAKSMLSVVFFTLLIIALISFLISRGMMARKRSGT